jgi:two-component system sensor histidine kinase YesM
MQWIKNLRLRSKLFLSYLPVLIIPLVFLGIYSYTQARVFLVREAEKSMDAMVGQMAENIHFKLLRYDTVITTLTYNVHINQMLDDTGASQYDKYIYLVQNLDPLVSNILNMNYELDNLIIYTSNTGLVERTNSIRSIERLRDEPWFQSVMDSRQVHWVRQGERLVGICRFLDIDTNTQNLLYAEVDYSSFFRTALSVRETLHGIYISDGEGNLLFSQPLYSQANEKEMPDVLQQQDAGQFTLDGEDYLLLTSAVGETGWMIHYYLPVRSLVVDISSILFATIVVTAMCLCLMLLLNALFSGVFTKRINRLNNSMAQVESGNIQLHVSSSSRDEIGQLTNRFASMLAKLRQSYEKTYQIRISQKEAEVKALQAQINPHLLYNSLSIINWKAIYLGDNSLNGIIVALSRYYRSVLNKGMVMNTLAGEMENLRLYLTLQLHMHDNSFDVLYDIPTELMVYDVPNLVLQPLVENAIAHGVDEKRDGRGIIQVSGRVEGQDLILTVQDNGPGIPAALREELLHRQSGGYGLRNVNERLLTLYGQAYALKIIAPEGKGTTVRVCIPVSAKMET